MYATHASSPASLATSDNMKCEAFGLVTSADWSQGHDKLKFTPLACEAKPVRILATDLTLMGLWSRHKADCRPVGQTVAAKARKFTGLRRNQ